MSSQERLSVFRSEMESVAPRLLVGCSRSSTLPSNGTDSGSECAWTVSIRPTSPVGGGSLSGRSDDLVSVAVGVSVAGGVLVSVGDGGSVASSLEPASEQPARPVKTADVSNFLRFMILSNNYLTQCITTFYAKLM